MAQSRRRLPGLLECDLYGGGLSHAFIRHAPTKITKVTKTTNMQPAEGLSG
jgi:hypothetical protein